MSAGRLRKRPATPGVAVIVLVASGLAGCAIGPEPLPPSADTLGLPSSYATPPVEGVAEAESAIDLAHWWRAFGDPTLADLIERAIAGNPGIEQALSRVERARALRGQTASAQWPQLGIGQSASRSGRSDGPEANVYAQGIDARWTLDLFGGQRRAVQAADADLAAAEFSLANAQSLLAAEVANTYIDLRTARRRIVAARASLEVQEKNLQVAGWRAQGGLVSRLDVEQTRALRAQTAATVPSLEQIEANARYRLAVLLGRAPGALDIELAADTALPTPPLASATGLPTALLTRRPDLRVSERELAAAVARIGVAKAQRYPGLTLSASVDSTASRFSDLGDVLAGNVLLSMAAPLFDAGQRRAAQRAQEAAADIAYATYRGAVLDALEDVDRALVARDTAERRRVALSEQREASVMAATLARLNYREGVTDLRALLESERSLLAAEDALAGVEGERLKAAVQLYLALGGGWSPEPGATAAIDAPHAPAPASASDVGETP
ncbi:MAG: efflux transporter outer membrane subunit [Silanimonas sp.]